MRRLVLAAIAAATLVACSQQATVENTAPSESKADEFAGMTVVDLSPHGLPGEIMVPDKSKTGVDPTIIYDDMTSHINIMAGKNYNIFIREEDMSLDLVKSDLEGDLMFKNEIVEETGSSLLIKRNLPDGTGAYFHFAAMVNESPNTVFMKSNDLGKFTESQARKMMQSALTLKTTEMLVSK